MTLMSSFPMYFERIKRDGSDEHNSMIEMFKLYTQF